MHKLVCSVSVAVVLLLPLAAALPRAALAQDRASRSMSRLPSPSQETGGMFGAREDRSRRALYLQADQLIYDTRGNR
jgi:hypothetical protein